MLQNGMHVRRALKHTRPVQRRDVAGLLLVEGSSDVGRGRTVRETELKHVLDPAAGLRCVESEPWDLVITDIEMPGMTGIELLQRVHLVEPALPVAVVTAHATVDRAVSAQEIDELFGPWAVDRLP